MTWLVLGVASLGAAVALLLADRRRRRAEAEAYLKGVRYVLSDDPDAAIEALSDAARLGSPEAVETYLALGALFRRTGDLARAIRLHRNMLLRPGLDPQRRSEVTRELADDYRRAGMLAEAAEVYRPLAGAGDRLAREGLRDVRLEQGDLEAAVALQRQLGAAGEDPVLAHLLASLARSRLPGDVEVARREAKEALRAAPSSADAWLALGEARAAAGESGPALEALGRALSASPGAALLAWPLLAAVRDREAAQAFLAARVEASPDAAALRFLQGRLLHAAGRTSEALEELRRALEADESGEVTLAMRDLLRVAAAPGPEELAARHDLVVAALLRRTRPLRCRRCGGGATVRAWRCPRCGLFDAYA